MGSWILQKIRYSGWNEIQRFLRNHFVALKNEWFIWENYKFQTTKQFSHVALLEITSENTETLIYELWNVYFTKLLKSLFHEIVFDEWWMKMAVWSKSVLHFVYWRNYEKLFSVYLADLNKNLSKLTQAFPIHHWSSWWVSVIGKMGS